MTLSYLERLTSILYPTVEPGPDDDACATAGPLLMVSGAGAEETNTLAHRKAQRWGDAQVDLIRREQLVARYCRALDQLEPALPMASRESVYDEIIGRTVISREVVQLTQNVVKWIRL